MRSNKTHQPVVLRSGGGAADRRCSRCRTCPAPASSTTTSSRTASSTTTSTSSTSASITTCRPAAINLFARYSFQNTDRHRAAAARRSGRLGRLRQRHPESAARARSAAGRASSARRCSTSSAFGYNTRALGRRSTRRSASTPNAQYGINGVPKDPRFYGGLPHMPIARFARLGGPFFRPQFQTSQVFQFAEQPDLAARAATR